MNEDIFRAYDIRGVYSLELDEKTSYYIGVAFGNHIKQMGKTKAIIGHDNRSSSISLTKNLISGIADTGIDIINIGLATTPMFYYAREYLNIASGIMVTASHSPAEYNGMKIAFNEEGRIYGDMIASFKEEVKVVINGFDKATRGLVTNQDIKELYLKMLGDKIKLGSRKIKVVIDCGNATGSIVAEQVFKNAGCEVIPLYCELDSSFPNHHPDPAVEENLIDLKAKVLSERADLGISFDGDADRVGIVDEQGKMIYADMVMAIICRNIIPKLTDKRILVDIKCTKALEDEIIKLGGQVIYNRPGHSYMVRKLKADNIAFGGELAGHFFFNDSFYGYDDGIYAGLRLLEILSNTEKPISTLLDGLNKYYATPLIDISVNDDVKFKVVDDIITYAKEKNYQMILIDGIRVLFDDGWALIRASNTGPKITIRFEAVNEERLNIIKDEFEAILKQTIAKY